MVECPDTWSSEAMAHSSVFLKPSCFCFDDALSWDRKIHSEFVSKMSALEEISSVFSSGRNT
jgi:hypothetical protein